MDGEIHLEELCKKFDDFVAVDGIDLYMPPGEFFTLLGPSGCGKTTTLRMVAGFERPTSGRILLDGSDVARVPPHQRNVNTVFQSYALFPHLDVAKNVAFGLKYHKLSKDERAKRVGEALELVDMTEFARRKADQLSGGQQQRVALARALVLRPRVLLLDEPLGALDAQLRKNLQVELKALQAELGITFVFVTHDQAEALTMSDRIAVMNGGRVEQAASPKAIYEEPDTVFVADFLGVSNLLGAKAMGPDGGACAVQVGDRTLRAQQGATEARGEVKVMIRPERIVVEPHANEGEQRMPGMVERSVYLGGAYEVHIRVLGGELLKAMVPNDGGAFATALEPGAAVSLHLPSDALRVLIQTEPEEPDEDAVSMAAAEAAQPPR
ncbi:MAG: ABC transporter ATP-binding protein [Thermoleophilaceae bacterium]|nr:ABC transporter ATP-binding protein [Thermoleophilaceae bacterium]